MVYIYSHLKQRVSLAPIEKQTVNNCKLFYQICSVRCITHKFIFNDTLNLPLGRVPMVHLRLQPQHGERHVFYAVG